MFSLESTLEMLDYMSLPSVFLILTSSGWKEKLTIRQPLSYSLEKVVNTYDDML